MQIGGLILCGGRSTRMGLSKATLPFGPESMLERVVRILSGVVSPIVVVAAPDQSIQEISGDVIVVRDRREGRGPLEGLAAGLSSLPEDCDAAYVTSCDVPLLVPEFVRRMIELVGEHEIAVPEVAGRLHPLAAVYRRTVLPHVESLLAADQLRLQTLYEHVATRFVAEHELIDVDPELLTLRNLNQPHDYFDALQRAGFTAPRETIDRFNTT